MTAGRRGPILDRELRASWMDLVLGISRTDGPDARSRLESAMRDLLPAPEARTKTVGALVRAWITPPEPAAGMIRWARNRAESIGDARVLHIGALLAVYPFVADAWAAVGRELLFRGDVHMEAVRKRLLATWGQREAVRVGARAAIRTLRSLAVLKGKPGDARSLPGDRLVVPAPLAPWIAHALCLARSMSELGLSEILSAPELFMLELPAAFSDEYPLLERLVEGGGRKIFRVRPGHQNPAETG